MEDNIKNKNSFRKKNSLIRSNSFTKLHSQIIKIPNPIIKDISMSSKNISSSLIFENLIKEKGKKISRTIFEEKFMKKSLKKLSQLISPNSDLKNICDMNENINNDNADYLQVRKIKKISKEEFETLKNEITRYENLDAIYDDFMNENCLPLNEVDFAANISCILPFRFLVEFLYDSSTINVEEMNYRYELFNKYIYNYRRIKGDGNCFYRAIIFRYIELVIINKKIELLKNIINEMDESFKSNEVSSRMRIRYGFKLNYKLVLLIMIIILNLLENGTVEDAHYFFVKSIVICDSFDYGLILYFRYIFYLYIKKNENKIYLKNFPIKIGNLLPSYYETEQGLFLFNKFYYLYLLSMFTDAEKIIIHLTPFVLGINLDVIIFDDNEDKTIKNMIFYGEPDYNFNDDKFFVLNVIGHYELLYTQKDNVKYKNIFQNYVNDYYSNILIKDNSNNESQKEKENNNNGNNRVKPENNAKVEEINNEKTDNEIKVINNKSSEDNNATYSIINIKKNNMNKNDEKDNKDNDEEEQNKNYKVQIKIINNTSKKMNNLYQKGNDKTESTKYSEKKESNYKNLINIKNYEKNNNIDKKVDNFNSIKVNLNNRMKNEINEKDNKKDNKKLMAHNSLINIKHIPQLSNKTDKHKINKIVIGNKCQICKRNNIDNTQNDIFSNICFICLKETIINNLSEVYLSYLEDLIFNKMQELAFKTYFKNFLEMRIDILNNNISIKDLLNEFDNKNQEKTSQYIEMHPLFQEIKKKICIFCLNDLEREEEIRYEIPCKCKFCCIEHIKKYFHLKNPFRNKSNYICVCSHEYSNEDIYNIGLFFNDNKLYSLREDTIEFLNRNYLEKQCCFCYISLKMNEKFRISIKDFEDENVLGDTNKLKHFICKICNFQYRGNVDNFSCFICNKNHIVFYK